MSNKFKIINLMVLLMVNCTQLIVTESLSSVETPKISTEYCIYSTSILPSSPTPTPKIHDMFFDHYCYVYIIMDRFYVNLTQVIIILEAETTIKRMTPTKLACGQAYGVFSFLMTDVEGSSSLWTMPLLGWWFLVF